MAALPAIDPNDVRKSMMAFHLFSTFCTMVPLVDCSQVIIIPKVAFILISVLVPTKGIVGLDLKWKYDVKIFPAKELASYWLTSYVSQSEARFLAGNSVDFQPDTFFFISDSTHVCIWRAVVSVVAVVRPSTVVVIARDCCCKLAFRWCLLHTPVDHLKMKYSKWVMAFLGNYILYFGI